MSNFRVYLYDPSTCLFPQLNAKLREQINTKDHVFDIGSSGTASHASTDGTSASDRAQRYGRFAKFGECLWYGAEASDPVEVTKRYTDTLRLILLLTIMFFVVN